MQRLFVAALAAGIFLTDSFVDLPDAIAVLYVVVILLSTNLLGPRGLQLLAIACSAAAVLGFALSGLRDGFAGAPAARLAVSLVAIAVITVLAMRNGAAVAALRDQASLLDLTHDAILVRGAGDDVVTYWNSGAAALYGVPAAAAVGRPMRDIARVAFARPQAEIAAELERTERWEGEATWTLRDGRKVVVASRWSLRRDDNGAPAAIMETNTDITDMRLAENALGEAQNQLAHAARVATLGELTASIAHEINQPLTAVVTNGQVCLRLLESAKPDLAEIRAAAADVVTAGLRAGEIIGRLRTMFQKAAGPTVRIDLNEAIREVVPLVQRELASRHVLIRLELTPDRLPVAGDRVQLQQVIINLVLNAADAMARIEDGRRELTVRTSTDASGRARVAVSDCGPGLGGGVAERLFEPFFTTKPSGLGMGLSICRTIVENHGGRIEATNNAGPGATFVVTLPPAPQE